MKKYVYKVAFILAERDENNEEVAQERSVVASTFSEAFDWAMREADDPQYDSIGTISRISDLLEVI